jgi:predicted GIY-YIG superfamily endonuclease
MSNGRRGSREAMRVMTTEGPVLMTGLTADERSTVGRHHNAIKKYTRRNNPTDLAWFIDVHVRGRELETRLDVLDWWAMTGELDYESIYEQVG